MLKNSRMTRRQEEEEEGKTKTGRGWKVEKVEKEPKTEKGAPWPDHTDTLGSVSPCQLCAAVDSERTRSHTHILNYARWTMRTYLACVCEGVSVCSLECVSLPMHAKAPRKTLCLFSLCSRPLLCRVAELVCTSVCEQVCLHGHPSARLPARVRLLSASVCRRRHPTTTTTARMRSTTKKFGKIISAGGKKTLWLNRVTKYPKTGLFRQVL